MIGKKNGLSLLSAFFFFLCNDVQSSKITSYFDLFSTKYFQFGCQNVFDRFFAYLLNINIMET